MRANFFYRHSDGNLYPATAMWDTVPVKQRYDGLVYAPEVKDFDVDWNNHDDPIWDAAEPICDRRGFREFHIDDLDFFDIPEDELEIWAVDDAGYPVSGPLEHTPKPAKRKVIVCAGYVAEWDGGTVVRVFDTVAERDAHLREVLLEDFPEDAGSPDELDIEGLYRVWSDRDQLYGLQTFEHEAIR